MLPSDWPGPGPIDLACHDLPHASSTLEWWYVNSHFETVGGERFGLFAAFFREAKGRNEATGEYEYAHSITWGLSDPNGARFFPVCAVDAGAAAFGLHKLTTTGGVADERINCAMREVLSRGKVPGPTRIFPGLPRVGKDRLALDYGGDRFTKRDDGCYELHLHDPRTGIACDLTFSLQKTAIRHGNDGVVHGVADELMFYYFVPRCEVSGSVVIEGVRRDLLRGSGWYDHEFGFVPANANPATDQQGGRTAWTWASVQLEGGTDVSVYSITRIATGELLDNWVIVSDPEGRRTQHHDVSWTPQETWRSTRSFVEHPTRWRLVVPRARIELELEATFPDQEVLTVISDLGFWEGQVRATGQLAGASVRGLGWVERKGFRFEQLDDFFQAAGVTVRREVEKLLPLDPSPLEMNEWVVRRDEARCTEGLDAGQLARTLIKPVREIIDRGGKSWRSFAALACIDVVGGDSRKFLHWLPFPEILHVGSLIVDDVEDRSEVRRGGPTAHLIYGEGPAINAGTAAYFIAEPPLHRDDLPAETKLRIYRLYFDGMRAGHAGQAIDLDGLSTVVPAVVESGDASELERRVLAIHRLKTAVPAAMFSRIGAILGGGSEAQIEGIGRYFEAIGLAFQIVDDVLNLRGFRGNLKAKGEDVQHGKITLPVVKALGRLPQDERRWLWSTVSSKPRDEVTVKKVIDRLERAGAIDACAVQARALVEEAWQELDPLLEDSQGKVMFRAFGWYVLERQY